MSRSAMALAGAVLFLLWLPQPAWSQTGRITGTVTDGQTGEPVETAQVYIPGTRIGTLTDQNGEFELRAVPAGQHELWVEIIGYRTESRMVTVAAGETQVLEFALEPGVLRLQELVVTGTAARMPRVKLPFTVEKLDLDDMPVPAVSVETQLQAKAAGVHVVSGSGQPGDEASIMLRGPTTITGSQAPLVIVDGVLTWNTLADIDALDIESIEIVKGPAAASLYGSLAANGVIQITTRRGAGMAVGTSQMTVRAELGAQDLEGSFPFVKNHPYAMNEDQTAFVDALGNEIEYGPGLELDNLWDNPDPTQVTFQDKPYPDPTYDQVERFFDPGEFVNLSVAATGKTGNTNYRASFSSMQEEGVVMFHEGYKRRNARLNLDHQLWTNFSLSLGGYYAWAWQDQTWGWYDLTFAPPNIDMLKRDENGELIAFADTLDRRFINPLYWMEKDNWERENSRLMGSLYARYSPVGWLDIEADFGLDRNDWHELDFGPRVETSLITSQGWSYRENERSKNVNASLTAAFHEQFGDFITRGQARYQFEDRQFESFRAEGRDLGASKLPRLDLTSPEGRTIESWVEEIRSSFFYFIAAVDYKGKYIVDGLVRRDGSSLFGADQRWHTYYRGSLAWRPSQESWWGLDPTIGELKLRYSYGTAGNRPAFSAQYETYSQVAHGTFGPQTLGNRELKPEFAIEQEFGLDMLWWDRFNFGITYSDSKTEDAHLNVPLPTASGFVTQWQNAGTIDGHTWEISLEAALLERPNMSWTARLNWDRTRQRITELNTLPYRTGAAAAQYVREGEPLGTFYGNRWATSCAELHPDAQSACADQFEVNDDGFLVWVGEGNSYRDGISSQLWGSVGDVNGQSYTWGLPIKGLECEEFDPDTGDCTLTDFRRLGDATPDFGWNLSTNFRWKNLSLYLLLDSEIGQDIYFQTGQWALREWMSAYVDQAGKPDELKKPLTYYSTLYNVNANNSFFVHDGSYLKLRELSLSYTFGRDPLRGVFGRLGLEQMTIQLIGRNLFTWTDYPGYDPEVGRGAAMINRVDDYLYPNYRTITAALSLTF